MDRWGRAKRLTGLARRGRGAPGRTDGGAGEIEEDAHPRRMPLGGSECPGGAKGMANDRAGSQDPMLRQGIEVRYGTLEWPDSAILERVLLVPLSCGKSQLSEPTQDP